MIQDGAAIPGALHLAAGDGEVLDRHRGVGLDHEGPHIDAGEETAVPIAAVAVTLDHQRHARGGVVDGRGARGGRNTVVDRDGVDAGVGLGIEARDRGAQLDLIGHGPG